MRMGNLGQDWSTTGSDPLAFLGLSPDASASDVTAANVAAMPDPTSVAISNALSYPYTSAGGADLMALVEPSQPANVTVAAQAPAPTTDASVLGQMVQVGAQLYKYVQSVDQAGNVTYVPQPVSPMQRILSNPVALLLGAGALFLILS